MLQKQKSRAFKKDVYLLGEDSQGIKYWLESPSWDCESYWGFGYIETYINNDSPSISKDINSHQHADNFMSEYFTEWNGSKPVLTKQTFTEKEGWKLSELFRQFYHWEKHAEIVNRGGCHYVSMEMEWYKPYKGYWKLEAKKINEIIIPEIMDKIIKILTPKTS